MIRSHLVSLPDSDKREEKGNRPAIAVQTDVAVSPMLMIVPVTSSLGALRFPFTVRIEPSVMNALTLLSVAMVFQMRAIAFLESHQGVLALKC
ncbi:type II toxin-antitoxin system PemK/MazF family toxin [Aerosakkonemataceae cyanobacterium BLCC-F50]|uniref:Type II toxin-antitoxin system PemK/MazF family toxin n=1 Tax=Floridaenema flaviceps BLCC-F50 TaxID=3153642 RepID=A0ABV4XUM7_9CYAN